MITASGVRGIPILPAIPGGLFPPIIPTPQPSFFPGEALSAQEKADLVAYLEIL